MGTRQYHFVIEEKTMRGFRAYIMRKTGDLKKGDLSKWVETIIKNSMREEQQQQQHTTCNRHAMSKEEEMIATLTELMKAVKALLWNDPQNPMDISCGNSVHKKVLKNAISELRGNDYRTTKKWIDRLLEFSFIRKAPSNQYKILNDGHDSYDIKEEHEQEQQKEFDSVIEGLE